MHKKKKYGKRRNSQCTIVLNIRILEIIILENLNSWLREFDNFGKNIIV